MIRTAIMELKEEWGSKKESISGFIEKNFEGLPLGHASFLSHHLRMLCGTGEIVCKNDRQYMLSVDQVRVEEECQVEGQGNQMVNGWNKTRRKQQWRKVGKGAAEASEQEVEVCHILLFYRALDLRLLKVLCIVLPLLPLT